jgi:hypothetical protein
VAHGQPRSTFIEEWLSTSELAALSEDDRRNEADGFAALFSEECRLVVEQIFDDAMRKLRGLPFEQSKAIFETLQLIQVIVARGLWKHRCSVGERLEAFAREFDRLDVQSERERLYAAAQIQAQQNSAR